MKFPHFRSSLRNKLLSVFLLSLCFTILVLVTSYFNLKHLGKASDAILKRNYQSILASQEMITALDLQNRALLNSMIGNKEQGRRDFLVYERNFEHWLSKATDNITEKGEQPIIHDVESAYLKYLMITDELQKTTGYSTDQKLKFYDKTIVGFSDNVKLYCSRLREVNQRAMFQLSEKARDISHRAIVSLWLIGLASILLGIIFSITIANQLMKPINLMLYATQAISEGRYDTLIKYHSDNELGHLTDQFNSMTSKLKMFNDMNIKAIMTEKQKNDAIIQNIDDGIIVVDEDFKLININQKAAKVFHIDPLASLNRHFLEITNNTYLFDLLKRTFQTGKIPEFLENENILALKSNEGNRYYQFLINPVMSDHEKWYGLLLLLRDVTKLKEIDQLKSEFVMIVSHELKTPLTSIGMSVDLLLENPKLQSSKDEMELLSIAHEEVVRLKALISDILDLSKMEAGKIELDFQAVHPEILLENTYHIFQLQAEEKNIKLSMHLLPDLPAIRADINKINWVISNLVSNAVRYVKEGDFITLAAEKSGNFILFSIKDTGPGIPEEFQSKIFDRFVRIKDTQEGGGTGLGLAICKEIVRAHAGTIWVESEFGKGSNFMFTIPIIDTYTKIK